VRRFLASLIFIALSAAAPAFAFCGFYVAGGDAELYNDATQAVLMRHGDTTVLSMQNAYEGPAEDFAMVVPVPEVLQKENVKTLEKEVFDRVDQLSSPRLVEYWERDPCAPAMPPGVFGALGRRSRGAGLGMSGQGFGGGGYVKVEAEFAVGEYDVVILSTNEATALDTWLKDNQYNIPDGARPYFRPYVESGMYFFVAKVNIERVEMKDGEAVLSPLRFHYESDEFSLPIRLGMINSKGKQDLLVYILAHDQRYEVANYPNVTIPTNIEVGTATRENFGEFYEALFSRTVEENPGAVVTEYSWAATKCDPCPTGILGGGGLRPVDLTLLGNDILKVRNRGWNQPGWTLTRLHARYGKDDIGEDLVFQKADPILGGREIRDADGQLEKGANPSGSANNFQGRYIIRHDWEGDVACEDPKHGNWGPPPNPQQMHMIAEVVVEELRRQKAEAEGRELTAEDLEAPRTKAEKEAIAHHLRKRFGTSVAPKSATGGPSTAPSANTRGAGAAFGGGGVTLASIIREPVPELKLEPAPEPVEEPAGADEKGEESPEEGGATDESTRPGTDGGGGRAVGSETEDWPPGKPGCSTAGGHAPWPLLLLMGLGLFVRRRRR
jgi:MYXO-CTERM domain-containing protein